MTEQVAAPAANAAPVPMSVAQGAQALAERRAQQVQPQQIDKSEAARTLGKAGAEALAKRRAEAANAAQEAQQTTTDDPEANALSAANGTQAGETESEALTDQADQVTDGESQAIEAIPLADDAKYDLGDGVVVTAEEVRDGFMLKADHTKKTMALAEERKAFESQRDQKLSRLDKIVLTLQASLPQPKSRKEFTDEFGWEEGMDRFEEQNAKIARINAAQGVAERERFALLAEKTTDRDKVLAETYRKEWTDAAVRDKEYTDMSAFALSLGASPEQLREMVEPWMLKGLHMAFLHHQAEQGRSKIVQTIADKPKITKPGAKVTAQAGAQNSYQNAMGNLKKSGQLQDAVAALRARRALGGR